MKDEALQRARSLIDATRQSVLVKGEDLTPSGFSCEGGKPSSVFASLYCLPHVGDRALFLNQGLRPSTWKARMKTDRMPGRAFSFERAGDLVIVERVSCSEPGEVAERAPRVRDRLFDAAKLYAELLQPVPIEGLTNLSSIYVPLRALNSLDGSQYGTVREGGEIYLYDKAHFRPSEARWAVLKSKIDNAQ